MLCFVVLCYAMQINVLLMLCMYVSCFMLSNAALCFVMLCDVMYVMYIMLSSVMLSYAILSHLMVCFLCMSCL